MAEHRPWGWFETLARGDDYLVKRLRIHVGKRISLQRHAHRSEHWVVVSGFGRIELDGRVLGAEPGTSLTIPVGCLHRAGAVAGPDGVAEDLEIVEVQRGALLREDDIERLEDDFGRIAPGEGGRTNLIG